MKKLNKKQKIIGFIAVLLVAVIVAIVITTNIVSNDGIMSEGYAATANASSTLVANYIKKGITIGGITGTLESLNTFDATARPEDVAWGKTCYVKGEKITGTRRTLNMLEIGDYVDYTPDTASSYYLPSTYSGSSSNQTISQETLKWQILSINNDGTVDLISSTPTSQRMILSGELGYNNGVYLLNNIAESLYSNISLNATGRCVNIEDIEKHMTNIGKEKIDNYTPSGGVKYGNTKSYTGSSNYYPILYAQEEKSGINGSIRDGGIGESDSYYSSPTSNTYGKASSSLLVTQTSYSVSMNNNCYEEEKFFDLIHNAGYAYWLASRSVNTGTSVQGTLTNAASFGFHFVGFSYLDFGALFFSDNSRILDSSMYFRPVVTLSSSIKVTGGEGTSSSPYQISK